jgi:predicted transcriptional regulator
MTVTILKMVMAAMADPDAKSEDIARQLDITTTTLYTYINGDGSVKAVGQSLPRG